MFVCLFVFPRTLPLGCMCPPRHAWEWPPERHTKERENERALVSTKKKQLQKAEEVYTGDFAELQELLYLERQQTFTMSVCVCARVCTQEPLYPCASVSAKVHVFALKLINVHNWRLPVIWWWGQRKLFCGTLIILVRTLRYKYCQRYTLHPAFLSSLHSSRKWKTCVLQENKISMHGVVFRFFTTSLDSILPQCHTYPKKALN